MHAHALRVGEMFLMNLPKQPGYRPPHTGISEKKEKKTHGG